MTLTMPDTMPEITDEKPLIRAGDVLRLLDQAARDRGENHVSTKPTYVLLTVNPWVRECKAEVECVVGYVLHALGMSAETLGYAPLPGAFQDDGYPLPARFTPIAESMLDAAMNQNDSRWTWGNIARNIRSLYEAGRFGFEPTC